MSKETHNWLGRPILHEDDSHDLEMRAAVHEFGGKLPRHEAEAKAHEEYVKDWRLKASAHHLSGMRAAQGAGQMDEARKHGALYEMHMNALGLNPHGPVPPEVQSKLLEADGGQSLYRFKAHRGDIYALNDHSEAKAEEMKKHELGVELLKKVAELPLIKKVPVSTEAAVYSQEHHDMVNTLKRGLGQPRATSIKLVPSEQGAIASVKYHDTEVAHVHMDHGGNPTHVVLHDGGWKTRTTMDRHNTVMQLCGMGHKVAQTGGKWMLRHPEGHSDEYSDGMTVHRSSLDKAETEGTRIEMKRDSCDFTAKSTKDRCKNPRSRKVAGRYLCHWHADLAAKEDHKAEKA